MGLFSNFEVTTMLNSHREQDSTDAVTLWRSLRDYLKIDINVSVPEGRRPNEDATIWVTTTNSAPLGPEWPTILFEEILLQVTQPGGVRFHRGQKVLSSGDEYRFEHKCPFSYLPDVRISVQASVSRERFFQTVQEVALPGSWMS